VCDSYEAIVAACKNAWDFLINDPDRIASIGKHVQAHLGAHPVQCPGQQVG
jgi:hypothetical protein